MMLKKVIEAKEADLKKMWNVGYNYEMRATQLNVATSFVFKVETFDELMSELVSRFPVWTIDRERLVNYAMARWYNYQSAKFGEAVFAGYRNVQKATPEEDMKKHIDFYINGVPFDLKNVTYPAAFKHNQRYARSHPRDLIHWLYANQSQKSMQSFGNKIYIVMHSGYRPNWMLKAELFRIKKAIGRWMQSYNLRNMNIRLDQNIRVKSDLIWITE